MTDAERSGPAGGARARVLAVDDHPSFLALLRDLVLATRHLEVAGEESSGESAITTARHLKPAMVLMDIRMPGIGGIEAAEVIKAESPATIVVLVSTTHPEELPPRARTCSADAVIWKSVLEPRLLDDLWLTHADRR